MDVQPQLMPSILRSLMPDPVRVCQDVYEERRVPWHEYPALHSDQVVDDVPIVAMAPLGDLRL
jgi:hypothetical protein